MDEQCPICKDAFGSSPDIAVVAMTCGHKLHEECMKEFCNVQDKTMATINCPVCSLNSHDVRALEVRQGIDVAAVEVRQGVAPETIVDIDDGDEDDASTDLSATTDGFADAVPAPAPEEVPAPDNYYVPTRVHDYY